MQGRNAPRRPLGQRTFHRHRTIDLILAEPYAKGINQLTDVDFGIVTADMSSDRLPLDNGFDPRGRERGAFNAKAGINDEEPVGEQLGEMLRLPVWTREPDAGGLGDVIDAEKHKIEPARTDASRLQIEAKLVAEFCDDALQILGIADRLGETQFGARHVGRD